MSRIGRKPITVPDKVKIAVKDGVATVSGPMGNLTVKVRPEVQIDTSDAKSVVVKVDESKIAENRAVSAYWGTTRALIQSAIIGVTKGYEKSMEVVGVGWTAAVTGKNLKLVVGYANPVNMAIPDGLKVTVDKQSVKIAGPDKQMVGQFASTMRAHRKPEPYNGKGVKYTTEVIKKKAGKAFGSA